MILTLFKYSLWFLIKKTSSDSTDDEGSQYIENMIDMHKITLRYSHLKSSSFFALRSMPNEGEVFISRSLSTNQSLLVRNISPKTTKRMSV